MEENKRNKILVTGANGQLAKELERYIHDVDNPSSVNNEEKKLFDTTYERCLDRFIFVSHKELDITNYEALYSFIRDNDVECVINCAAYTNVESAEEHFRDTYEVNCVGPRMLGKACKELDVRLIHISTDYVFDGMSNVPYKTGDKVNPKSVYGGTKSEGETAIKISGCKYMIVRTSWLYSAYHKCFFTNMINNIIDLNKKGVSIKVVYDQVGSPTYAYDLARYLFNISFKDNFKEGIYHFSNNGVASWYDFTVAIKEMLINDGNDIKCKIVPCLSSEYQTKAKRPYYSVFDKKETKFDIPYWRESLYNCYKEWKNGCKNLQQ